MINLREVRAPSLADKHDAQAKEEADKARKARKPRKSKKTSKAKGRRKLTR